MFIIVGWEKWVWFIDDQVVSVTAYWFTIIDTEPISLRVLAMYKPPSRARFSPTAPEVVVR